MHLALSKEKLYKLNLKCPITSNKIEHVAVLEHRMMILGEYSCVKTKIKS